MATGTGKTEVFSHLPQMTADILPGQQMVLLHRDELAQQAYKKLIKRNPKFKVHIEAGPLVANEDADVVIASVQTLGRKGSKRINRFLDKKYDKFVVDEAHRSVADSYYDVYNAFNLVDNIGDRLLLGVTATPQRGDGQGLGALYQCIPYTYTLQQAIKDGYLVDVKGVRVNTGVSLDGVKTKGGDFDQGELADTVNNYVRNNLVASAFWQTCPNRTAIGFGVDIAHAQALAKTFQDRGINAEAVWGADPDRTEKIKAFRNGKIQVLFNAQLLTEGFDMAEISCVILAAPTKSGVVFSQRVGRGTRLCEGKEDVIILDVVDSTSRHSLITLPTLVGLPSNLNVNGRSIMESKAIIDEMLQEHSHLDFTTLSDIDKIEAFVENVNLFEIKFPEEVEHNSDFTWHPSVSGGYVLMMPNKNEITIRQNLLDKWELRGIIGEKKFKGERDTMEAAFFAADELVRKEAPEVLKIVKREAKWHGQPATPEQLKLIHKLYKGKQIPNLTKGAASRLIGSALAKGKKWRN